jgi:LysM repeat protein
MSRKDIIIISVLINAGLLVILLISALTSKEETAAMQPSVEVASSILEKNPEGMQTPLYDGNTAQAQPNDKLAFEPVKEETSPAPIANADETSPVHPLPAVINETTEVTQESAQIEAPQAPSKMVTVKKNDTLEKIAKRNHTTVQKIKQLNHLKGHFLKVGQKIKLPSGKLSNSSSKNQNIVKNSVKADADTLKMAETLNDSQGMPEEFYTVRVGDNLWTIAMKKHLKVSDLLSLNNLSAEKAKRLKPGDKIRVR